MAVPHKALIRDKNYHNWVKAVLALKYTKEGIESFINNATKDFHSTLIQQLGQQPQVCRQCTLNSLRPHKSSECPGQSHFCICSKSADKRRFCPNNTCGTLFTAIMSAHRFKAPAWKNSHMSQWVTDHWEIGKNFLPNTGGYLNITSAMETDLNGLINIGVNLVNITHRHTFTKVDNDNGAPDEFVQCRRARNEILHNASQTLTDVELGDFLSVMRSTLQCAAVLRTDPKAKWSLNKLSQLETPVFKITDEHILEVRRILYVTELTREYYFRPRHQHVKRKESVTNSGVPSKKRAIHYTRKGEIKENKVMKTDEATYQEQKSKQRQNLIKDYLAYLQIDTLPEVDRVYVEPRLFLESNSAFCSNSNMKMTDVFFKGETKFKRIYITGEIGYGKTALCNMLVCAWCQVHSGITININIPDNFLTVMENFDFLFYIPLRYTRNDYIVKKMIKKQYSMDQDFYNTFIKDECDKQSCLVLLDGLDEWCSPGGYDLPDFCNIERFTILTTTRPWKLEALRLEPPDIDRQVRLTGFCKEASDRYIERMVDLLNRKKNVQKESNAFKQHLKIKSFEHVRNIPILLKRLISWWHHDETYLTGRSQVDLYSAMINHLLRWKTEKMKGKMKAQTVRTSHALELPICLKEKQYCKIHKDLLLSLANLAFTSTLEGNLTFNHVEANLQHLNEDDIHSCLSTGLLCQEIYASPQDDENKKLSFLHKSFQDFLAAVFLVMNPDSSTLLQRCNTTQKFLDMRFVIIFACSMDSSIMRPLLQQIQIVAKSDAEMQQSSSLLSEQIQDLICECMTECGKSDQPLPSCHLETIIITSEWKNTDWRWACLKQIIIDNSISIKTLHVFNDEKNPPEEFLSFLEMVMSKCLSIQCVKLVLWMKLPRNIETRLEETFKLRWSSSLQSLEIFGKVPNALIPYISDDRDDQYELVTDKLQRKGKLFPKRATLTDLLHKNYNDKSIMSIISSHIQSLSKTILHVFACYKPDDEKTVVFLIMHDDEIESDVQEKLKKFNIFYRNTNHVNSEKREVFFRKVLNEEMFTKDKDENIRKCIAENSDEYFNKHSNISMILPNNVKSVGYGGNHKLLNKTCIVLFVPVKGLIPVGEEKFPDTIGDYATDVMEGTLSFFVHTAKERHENIKLGCQITSKIGIKGTVGPMIKLHDKNFAFITSGHVVFGYYGIDDLSPFLKTNIYQPDSDNAINLIGEVEKLIVDDEMEIAIIRLKDRWPRERGIFPECSSYVKENGFCSSNSYYSGEYCETDEGIEFGTKVYMFGSHSGATKGSVLAKTFETNTNFIVRLKNQLLVTDISPHAAFSQAGDSGSAVFVKTSDGSLKIVGILTSGGQGFYVVTPIWKIGKRIAEENYTPHLFKPNENLQTVKDYVKRLREEIKNIKSRFEQPFNSNCNLRTNEIDDVEMQDLGK